MNRRNIFKTFLGAGIAAQAREVEPSVPFNRDSYYSYRLTTWGTTKPRTFRVSVSGGDDDSTRWIQITFGGASHVYLHMVNDNTALGVIEFIPDDYMGHFGVCACMNDNVAIRFINGSSTHINLLSKVPIEFKSSPHLTA